MKKRIGILLSLVLVFICACALADVAINETNFPDENFRKYVSSYGYDIDNDGILSDKELSSVNWIDCTGMSISDLTGIEYFTTIKKLDCTDNQLTALDVSKNTALTDLWCNWNQLTTLDVSKNTALTKLSCYTNQLTTLDVSKNTALTVLQCNDNQLTSLNISKNTALMYLNCYSNQLTSLDISKNTALRHLNCYSNQLTMLDVSKNSALVWLCCEKNNLKKLDIMQIPALVGLVKETKPSTMSGVITWLKETGDDEEPYLYLKVDKDVDVIDGRVKINETHFPDENFRKVVSEFDEDRDGIFSDEELENVTHIDCEEKSISVIPHSVCGKNRPKSSNSVWPVPHGERRKTRQNP